MRPGSIAGSRLVRFDLRTAEREAHPRPGPRQRGGAAGALPLGSVDRVVLTGPQIVTKDTADQVVQYSEDGLR